MQPYLRVVLAIGLWGLAFCAAFQNTASAAGVSGSPDFVLQLSALDHADQNAPETLKGRLAYAQHLLQSADGDCRQRVDAAQRQLDLVVAKPAFFVAMPLGAAQAANIAYAIHSTRAACSTQASVQQSELQAARDAALRAVDLYRDGFDYQSMVVMQFNAAVADRRLGDRAGAATLLKTALEMDGEYGFRKDAEDNRALLQQWTQDAHGPNKDEPPTAPSRSIALKFAWSAKDADVTVAASYATVVKGDIVRSQGAATRAVSIRADKDGWVVSFASNRRKYEFDDWPQGHAPSEELSALLLANVQLTSPDIRVGGAGDFKSIINPDKVSAKLSAETTQLIHYILPEGDGATDLIPKLHKAIKYDSTPDAIEAMAAEDYDLTTAAWIGAKLDQGVWYHITAPLRAPGTAYFVDHDIQFAYTRAVPCTTSSTTPSCVEIILHATPNPVVLAQWIGVINSDLRLPKGKTLTYWAATDVRIITDPNSLLTYTSDMRMYWYFSINGAENGDPVINSERLVSTSIYR